jgi:hypothetical protein
LRPYNSDASAFLSFLPRPFQSGGFKLRFLKNLFPMRKMLFLLLLAGCTTPSENAPEEAAYTPPPAGTIVATDSFNHSDGLNDFLFKIAVKADSNKGVYTVVVQDGPRDATAQFTMPRNGEALPVSVKKEVPTAFVIGFKMPEDTTFYPYYRVGLIGTAIEMQYTNAYKL